MSVAIDSSVLLGLINPRDHRRDEALALHNALVAVDARLVCFDCVVAETISAAVRRLEEQKRHDEIDALFDRLETQAPGNVITWIMPDVPRLYIEIINLMRVSSGTLNFHDALIALACRERGILAIASFDSDFDQVTWLRRMASPEHVRP